MDTLDQAQELETLHREAALEAAKTMPAAQLIIAGVVHCQDCEEYIASARLLRVPTATRCVDCQQIHEHKEKQWSR